MQVKQKKDIQQCPRCSAPLVWRKHHLSWQPKRGQPFYFEKWLACSREHCAFIQHFEEFKRFTSEIVEAQGILLSTLFD